MTEWGRTACAARADGNVTGSEGVASVASFSYAGSYVAASGHRDELGPASMFAAPAGVAVVPPAAGGAASGASAYVCDAGNHAVRRLERRLPTRLRVSVSATDVSRFDGSAEELSPEEFPLDASAYARRDEVVDTYAYYSVNGPPGNETTHLADALSYRGETHDATMCAYPGRSTSSTSKVRYVRWWRTNLCSNRETSRSTTRTSPGKAKTETTSAPRP